MNQMSQLLMNVMDILRHNLDIQRECHLSFRGRQCVVKPMFVYNEVLVEQFYLLKLHT